MKATLYNNKKNILSALSCFMRSCHARCARQRVSRRHDHLHVSNVQSNREDMITWPQSLRVKRTFESDNLLVNHVGLSHLQSSHVGLSHFAKETISETSHIPICFTQNVNINIYIRFKYRY